MRRQIYLFVTAASAACGLVVEIAAGRMLAPYVGMSLYTWTAIIAVVLAGFSAGHWIGGRLAERPSADAHRSVIWALLAAGMTSVLALVLIRLVSGPILSLGVGAVASILTLTTVLFFAPSLFVGIPSPVLTKLAIDDEPAIMARTLGAFYAAGALGSIFGTLLAGYVFISWIGTIGTFVLVAIAYAAMAALLWFAGFPSSEPRQDAASAQGDAASSQNERGTSVRLTTLVVVISAGAVTIGLLGAAVRAFDTPCTRESAYYCIRLVDETAPRLGRARTMVLDHLAHGSNVESEPRALLTPYVELQDALTRIHTGRRTPFRAFFVGGGAYTLPRAWLAIRPDAQVTVSEVDPDVTAIAQSRMWVDTNDERLTVVHADARRSLARLPRAHFDVIVGDAFHDLAVPQHLVTAEFFGLVKERLRADEGIYVMNVVDRKSSPRLALSVVKTLQQVFPIVELWDLGESGARTTFVVAGLSRPTPYAQIPSRIHNRLQFNRMAPADITRLAAALSPLILTDDYAPVDRLIGVQ